MADSRRGPSVCDVQFLLKSPQVPRQVPTPPLDSNVESAIHMPNPTYLGLPNAHHGVSFPVITPSSTPFSPASAQGHLEPEVSQENTQGVHEIRVPQGPPSDIQGVEGSDPHDLQGGQGVGGTHGVQGVQGPPSTHRAHGKSVQGTHITHNTHRDRVLRGSQGLQATQLAQSAQRGQSAQPSHGPHVSPSAQGDIAFISHSPATFPHQNMLTDNANWARRKRRRTSPMELTILESEFKKCYKPTKMAREEIALKVGMTEKAVQIWFQNRRQSQRKQQQIVKLDTFDIERRKRSQASQHGQQAQLSPPVQIHHVPDYRHDYNTNPPFTIYTDNSTDNHQEQPHPSVQPSLPSRKRSAAPSLKLSMSDDGKAQVVISSSPLKPISGNRQLVPHHTNKPSLKLNKSFSGNSSRLKSALMAGGRPSSLSFSGCTTDPKMKDKEAECISNLLSLRSGVWN